VIDLARWHNWVALAVMLLLLGFVLHAIGRAWSPAGSLVKASFGA
jgi:hypothetical protein